MWQHLAGELVVIISPWLLQGYPFDLDDPETLNFFIKYARPMTGGRLGGAAPPLHRGPPGGRGAPDLGVPRGPPPRLGSRGGGMMMEGRGRGGRGGELQKASLVAGVDGRHLSLIKAAAVHG